MSQVLRIVRPLHVAVAALVMLMALPAAWASSNEARDWVRRMNEAVATRNYDGWFSHQAGGRSERLRIIHRMHGGHMNERVITTDGSGREFVRDGSEYVEYFPDRRVAVRETRNRSYGFFVALNGLTAESDRYYNVAVGGTERLINRDAQMILVEPKDPLRYGYRFWLDKQTAMPLKTQMVSRTGEVLEEISFFRLSLPESIPDDLLKPDVDTKGFRWMRRDQPVHNPEVKVAFQARPGALPAGFRVRNPVPAGDEQVQPGVPRTRFIVSDGIAWVSVFVENADGDARTPAAGRADGVMVYGALAAYVARTGPYKVTAFGEVPPATIRGIAEAFHSE